jgi:hypothetical protein
MPSYSKNEVILVRYPFSNLSGSKVRPAIVINAVHTSQDVIIVPLTSKVSALLAGEFVLADWRGAGLNVASAVKRGALHYSSELGHQIYRGFICFRFRQHSYVVTRMAGPVGFREHRAEQRPAPDRRHAPCHGNRSGVAAGDAWH